MTTPEPLSAEDRQRVLVDWNDTTTAVPDQRLHQLVEAQVDLSPSQSALELADRSISFGELERRANQLAHHLRGLGARPGTSVGVCLPRGFDLVITLLGILKAGAAFIPLDTAE